MKAYSKSFESTWPQCERWYVAISKELCSLKYATVDQAVRRILLLGEGSYLAKIDVFRNIPINPEDRIYLGMSWRGDLYIGTVLPFGLKEAPKIFNATADRCRRMDLDAYRSHKPYALFRRLLNDRVHTIKRV